jgi:hypothetical protein
VSHKHTLQVHRSLILSVIPIPSSLLPVFLFRLFVELELGSRRWSVQVHAAHSLDGGSSGPPPRRGGGEGRLSNSSLLPPLPVVSPRGPCCRADSHLDLALPQRNCGPQVAGEAAAATRRRSATRLPDSPRHPFVQHAVCTGISLLGWPVAYELGAVAVRCRRGLLRFLPSRSRTLGD